MYRCVCAKSLQSCPTLCDSMDHSPPGFSVHRAFQARILEWVTMPFSRGSSQPRDWTHVCYICTGRPVLHYYHHLVSLYIHTLILIFKVQELKIFSSIPRIGQAWETNLEPSWINSSKTGACNLQWNTWLPLSKDQNFVTLWSSLFLIKIPEELNNFLTTQKKLRFKKFDA